MHFEKSFDEIIHQSVTQPPSRGIESLSRWKVFTRLAIDLAFQTLNFDHRSTPPWQLTHASCTPFSAASRPY
jgi:hypothetical protein